MMKPFNSTLDKLRRSARGRFLMKIKSLSLIYKLEHNEMVNWLDIYVALFLWNGLL